MLIFFQEFFHTVTELLKLEKIEFGGLRGRSLSELVVEMFSNFQDLVTQLSNKSYDPLDPNNEVLQTLDL